MEDVRQHPEFDRQAREYLDAFNSGNFDKVASYWTEDAVSCPPVGEEIRGRAALREFTARSSQAWRHDFPITPSSAVSQRTWSSFARVGRSP